MGKSFPDTNKSFSGKDSFNYCRDIYKSIIKYGQKVPIYICYNSCNHYSIDDGQHRICIASKKRLRLKAYLSESNSICSVCYAENKISSIKKLQKKVNETTPKKTIFHKIFKLKPKESIFQDSLDIWKNKLTKHEIEKERDYRIF